MIVADGDAITVEALVELSPDDGVQLYVVPPLAASVTELPSQMVDTDGDTVITGVVFTVMATVAVSVHPPATVPVTV